MNLRAVVARTRYWQGLMLGLVVAAIINMNDATTAAGDQEPWPELLSGGAPDTDADFAALHQRAVAALERLAPETAEKDPL